MLPTFRTVEPFRTLLLGLFTLLPDQSFILNNLNIKIK